MASETTTVTGSAPPHHASVAMKPHHSRSRSEGCRIAFEPRARLPRSPSSLWITVNSGNDGAQSAGRSPGASEAAAGGDTNCKGGNVGPASLWERALAHLNDPATRIIVTLLVVTSLLGSPWFRGFRSDIPQVWMLYALVVGIGGVAGMILHAVLPQRNGHVVTQCTNGDCYEGDLAGGERSGLGVYLHSSSRDVYSGMFEGGQIGPVGVFKFASMGRYEGQWEHGKYSGYGIEYWEKGSRYLGSFAKGKRHGRGVYKFFTGDVFEGDWREGRIHGYGVQRCLDGSAYVGEYLAGMKHGHGTYDYQNGDRYVGQYYRDHTSGFGVYEYRGGVRFLGEWKDGARHGWGAFEHHGKLRWSKWVRGEEVPGSAVLRSAREAEACAQVARRAEAAGREAQLVRQNADGRGAESTRRAFRSAEHWASRARQAAAEAAGRNQVLQGDFVMPVRVGGEKYGEGEGY